MNEPKNASLTKEKESNDMFSAFLAICIHEIRNGNDKSNKMRLKTRNRCVNYTNKTLCNLLNCRSLNKIEQGIMKSIELPLKFSVSLQENANHFMIHTGFSL